MTSSTYTRSFVFRGVVGIPEPKQPPSQPPQPPVHDSRKSVDSASTSSGGTHSIPDQFYQADVALRSGEIDTHIEDNSVGNTPGSSKVDLGVLGIDEPNEDQARPREQYVKHTGCFADAAPRMAHSTGGVDEGLLGTTGNREDQVKDGILNPVKDDILNPVKDDIPDPETSETAAPPQETRARVTGDVKETPTTPTFENNNGQSEISEVRNVQVIARAQALYDFPGEDEGDLPFKVGDVIHVIEYCKFFSVSSVAIQSNCGYHFPTHNLSCTNVIVNDDWWRGILRKDVGIFPNTYVQQL